MKTETSLQSAYSTFTEQVKSLQIQRVTTKPDRVDYTLKPEFGSQRYYTQALESTEDLISLLQNQSLCLLAVINFNVKG